jgi:hypothetical protein
MKSVVLMEHIFGGYMTSVGNLHENAYDREKRNIVTHLAENNFFFAKSYLSTFEFFKEIPKKN